MKHRIIILFFALLFAFALVPVSSANAEVVDIYSIIYSHRTTVGSKYVWDVEGIIIDLHENNIPFLLEEVHNSAPQDIVYLFASSDKMGGLTLTDNVVKSDVPFYKIKWIKTIENGLPNYKFSSDAGFNMINYTDNMGIKDGYGGINTLTSRSYYNPNGGSIGDNAFIPPTPINEKDMLDIPVGTIRLMYPKDTAHLTIGDDGAELEIMIDGKSGYLNVLPSGFPHIGQAFYSIYLDDAMTKDYAISVNGKTVNSTVGVFNKFGKKEDWAENKFVTFEGGYKISMKELKSGPCTITFGCNVLIPNEQDLYYMEWKSVSVELNVEFQKDLNGDGYDDDTGKKLVNGAVLDNDGDGEPDGSYTKPIDENGTDFFIGFVNSIKNIPQYSSEIGRAFSSIFNMFPSPIPQLAVTGIIIMIFVAVISFIRGA